MAGYYDVLRQLFPLEVGGDHNDDLVLEGQLLDSAADSAEDLLAEAFADTTETLIGSWERVYDLVPESGASLASRRSALIRKMREVGGLTASYYEDLADGLGYDIDVSPGDEPFRAGISAAGDAVYDTDSIWTWTVTVNGAASAPELETIIEDLKPADTSVSFTYIP